MVNVNAEKIFFNYILKSQDYIHLVNDHFFDSEYIGSLFLIAKEFYLDYNKPPSAEQIKELVKIKGKEELLTEEKIDIIFNVDLGQYDEEWLRDNVEMWIEYRNLDRSIFDLINYMKTTKVDTENIKNVVDTAKSIILERNNLDFKFDEGLDFFDPDSHDQPMTDTFSTGYPHIDLVTGGGFSIKTLWVFLGQAKVGKSIWLANMASQSIREGYNSAYISLEMRDRKVVKRLGANLLNVKMSEYNNIARDKDILKQKIKNLSMGAESLRTPGKLYVKEYPTSTASVQDIERWLIKMEEMKGMKFKTVFVDYINIMRNWRNPNSENTYMKIKQLAEDLRAMAVRNEWCVVTATQVNRGGFDSSDLSFTNVSESAALIHTIDAMFGIIQEPTMHANNEYILKLLANRDDGYKNSKKKFNINYEYMRISERDEPMWSDD